MTFVGSRWLLVYGAPWPNQVVSGGPFLAALFPTLFWGCVGVGVCVCVSSKPLLPGAGWEENECMSKIRSCRKAGA